MSEKNDNGKPPIFEVSYAVGVTEAQSFIQIEVTEYFEFYAQANNSFTVKRISSFNTEIDVIPHIAKVKGKPVRINRFFNDRSGSHIIVDTSDGYYYINTQYIKQTSRAIHKLKGVDQFQIEAVAFSDPDVTDDATGEFLVGDSVGRLHVWNIAVNGSKQLDGKTEIRNNVLKVDHPNARLPINGITIEKIRKDDDDPVGQYYVMFASKTYLFQIVPGKVSTLYEAVKEYHDRWSKQFNYSKSFLTDDECRGTLATHPNSVYTNSDRFAWTSDPGIYIGKYEFDKPDRSADESAIGQSSIISLADEKPLACYITECHVLALFPGELRAYSIYDQSLVMSIPVSHDVASIAGAGDSRVLLYGATAMYDVKIVDELRHVWRIHANLGQFEEALLSSTDDQRHIVQDIHATHRFDRGEYVKAARTWGTCNRPIEEVIPLFAGLPCSTECAMEYLLVKIDYVSPADKMQLSVLLIWVMEIMLARMGDLEISITYTTVQEKRDVEQQALTALHDRFEGFITDRGPMMDRPTVYSLLTSHSRPRYLRMFAEKVNDHEQVIALLLDAKRFEDAQQYLQGIRSGDKARSELVYRHAGELMRHVPNQTVTMLTHMAHVEPRRLMDALLQYDPATDTGSTEMQDVRFLTYLTDIVGSTDPVVHNYLFTLYSRLRGDAALLAMIGDPETPRYISLQYALRLCQNRPAVVSRIYRALGMWGEAVELALSIDDVESAEDIARSHTTDVTAKKALWQQIVQYEAGQDITRTLEIVRTCEYLQLQDVLKYFKSFEVINNEFKETICSSLKQYSHDSEHLKKKMETSTRASEKLRRDIAALPARAVVLDADAACCVCDKKALTRNAIVFPCGHTAHEDCARTATASARPNDDCPVCGAAAIDSVDKLFEGTGPREEWSVGGYM